MAKDKRDQIIQIRISAADKARMVERSAAAGKTLTEWIVETALAGEGTDAVPIEVGPRFRKKEERESLVGIGADMIQRAKGEEK